MGLLDQVIGNVLGQLGGQAPAGGGGASPWGGGAVPPVGRSGPAPMQPASGGRSVNPLVLALLALVASRVVHQGAGGLGSKLHDLLTGGSASTGTGAAPSGGGLGGGGPSGGSFLDQIGGMMGGTGGLAAGGLGGLVGGGLGSLLERFQQNGQGDVMQSWIGHGANQPVSPNDLAGALGPGTVDELSQATGMGRDDLLSQLSQTLPHVVDGLTPQGRLPSGDEETTWV